MDLFVIDTKGSGRGLDLDHDNYEEHNASEGGSDQSESESDDDYGGLPPPSKDISHIIASAVKSDTSSLGIVQKKKQTIKDFQSTGELRIKDRDVAALDELIAISHVKESKKLVPIEHQRLDTVAVSNRTLLKLRKKERENTKGDKWFGMKKPEMTPEIKNELELISMRHKLDPKRFYKRSEQKTLPKFFEVGKVMASPLEYYNDRPDPGQKKTSTLVDELLADAEFQKRIKRKRKEAILKKKEMGFKKATKKMKQDKKKRRK